jgi:hypothetical protein
MSALSLAVPPVHVIRRPIRRIRLCVYLIGQKWYCLVDFGVQLATGSRQDHANWSSYKATSPMVLANTRTGLQSDKRACIWK